MARSFRLALTVVVAAALAGCAVERREAPAPQRRPADIRAELLQLLPPTLADRNGWATDILAAFQVLQLDASTSNLCAALAVTEQESSWRVDPPVPNLPKIAWAEIEKRADRLGVPMLLVRGALLLDSPTGKSYSERIDSVKTERELNDIFEDFIGMVPMGRRLFGDHNPVRTAGPMQVSVAFAEAQVKARPYPYPMTAGGVRKEVFTRRGLPLGEAHVDLHRPAGVHRVPVGEEPLAERHHADEVVEDVGQLAFGPRPVDALGVARAGGRIQAQRGVHREHRHAHVLGAAVDLAPGDGAEAGHGGVGAKARLLLGHRDHGADVRRRRRDA
jgi:hypothetical protein